MVEEIAKNLYRVEIPLPQSPLKSINSYMIKSPDRNLIIDTGMNRTVCFEAMQDGLHELALDLDKTDFFITHLHADHFGLVGRLATENSTVYFNRPDGERVHEGSVWSRMIEYAGENGFPRKELEAALQNHPGFKYGTERTFELTLVDDGDVLVAGDYELRCVQTPGHTSGHTCLYEPAKKLFFSGDHILIDITPNIQLWSDDENPLQQYLESLDKVSVLEMDLCLPGHRRLIKNCTERIRELKTHHRHRADEVLVILREGNQTAYEVASKMTWDINCDTWEEFPVSQKWFATGEAIAHLKYLKENGEISMQRSDGAISYSLP